MNENLKNILSNLNSEVDQQMLLKYLQGHLSAEEQHEVEKNLLEDAFDADALEGLENIEDKEKITSLVQQLNRDLKKKTSRKRKWKIHREAKLEPWLLFAIVLILLLAVIAFFVIHRMSK